MGTFLMAAFVLLFVVTGAFAFSSYRRHSRAARARSQAALTTLLAEAYDLNAPAPKDDEGNATD